MGQKPMFYLESGRYGDTIGHVPKPMEVMQWLHEVNKAVPGMSHEMCGLVALR